MAISSISSASAGVQQPNYQNSIGQQFGQLVSAIQSGNLSAAQSAYSTLSSQIGGNPDSPFAQALNQIGQALQSGNIDQAQQALSSLQQQAQQVRQAHGHHHHHHGGGEAQDASTTATVPTTDTATTLSSSGNAVDVSA